MNEQAQYTHDEVMPAVSAEIQEETLSDGSVAYNVVWTNGIDSQIVIACCDEKSAIRIAKSLQEDTVGFDVLQA